MCVLDNFLCWEEKTPAQQPVLRHLGDRSWWIWDMEGLQVASDFRWEGRKGRSTATGQMTPVPMKSDLMRKGPARDTGACTLGAALCLCVCVTLQRGGDALNGVSLSEVDLSLQDDGAVACLHSPAVTQQPVHRGLVQLAGGPSHLGGPTPGQLDTCVCPFILQMPTEASCV